MKNIMLFLMALAMSCHVMAQQATVTGTITDANDGLPVIGASILVKGTSIGTVTNIDGQYSVAPPAGKNVLVISCIGYKTQEITLKAGQTVLNIVLKEDSEMLEEVVVVGYGVMKKSDISGASVSVGEEKIKGSIITNLDQALQGRAAGVTSVMTSGAPGSSVSIRVRGQSTINANAEPLYVIDGVIMQGGGSSGSDFGLGDALGNGSVSTISPLSTINPSDIVSMEILKDASATAIYGAQGSNGVVLITTKRGKSGEAKFSYEGMLAVQRQNSRLKMMNLREFAEFSNSVAAESNSLDTRPEFSDPSLLGVGTNWQDAIFRTALLHQHQVSAQGGTDKVQYYVSGSFMDQEGTIIGSEFDRYSFRVNLDAQLKSWFKLGVNAMYSKTGERLTLADSSEGIVNFSLLTPPDIPIYDIDGNYATVVREGYTGVNPIAKAMSDDILLDRQKLNGNVFADITPIRNLVWHAELGFDIGNTRGERYEPMIDLGSWKRANNYSSIQRNNSTFWQLKNYVTYTGSFLQKHNYTVMLGQEAWESEWENQAVVGEGLSSDDVHNPSLGSSTKISSGFGSSAMASFFGRATYNYDDRYMATYTYRYDGSSNFGPKNRWAGFHAFAGSWRFTNEKFLESITRVLSNGKLRVGWGQTGNSNIGGYKWGAAISKMPTGLGNGFRQSNISNPYVKWEKQAQWNIGLDLSFFGDRIGLVIDLYDKTSKDMLMPLQLPSYMGTRGNVSSALGAPWGNYGTINNKGMEITLNTRNFTGPFEWDSEFQISFNKNKLVALDGAEDGAIEGYGQWSDLVSLTRIGKPLYNFYGHVCDGVYKDLRDLETSAKPARYPSDGVFNRYNTTWVGDLKYKDLNGDGVIDDKDKTDLGSPMPDFIFGFNNTFRYKNFDLNIFINGSYGNKIYNYMSMNLTNMKSIWNNQLRDVGRRARMEPIDPEKSYSGGIPINGVIVYNWFDDITNVKVSNPGTDIPRAIANDPNDNDRVSDRYIEDGSYLRVKNITLGYTFPAKMIRKWKLDNLRVYVNMQNVLTWTKYNGYDPEIGANTANTYVYGLDNGRYPSPQVYSFGLNVTF